jgi:hypothetical protein
VVVDADADAEHLCTNCGKQGHTASHCWFAARTSEDAQENANQNHTIPYCDYCGRNGHAEHNCWLKPSRDVEKTAIQELKDEIKELRAALMAQNSANDYRNETILCALDVSHKDKECCSTAIGDSLDFTCSMDSLGESHVWIADSGCSVHCTGRLQDMTSIISHGENGGDGYVQPDGTESIAIATIQMKTRKHVRKKSQLLFESKCVHRKLVADLHGFDLLLDRAESVGDRRKSSGSGPRTMTSGKMSEWMTSGVMSGKISGVEAVSRS